MCHIGQNVIFFRSGNVEVGWRQDLEEAFMTGGGYADPL